MCLLWFQHALKSKQTYICDVPVIFHCFSTKGKKIYDSNPGKYKLLTHSNTTSPLTTSRLTSSSLCFHHFMISSVFVSLRIVHKWNLFAEDLHAGYFPALLGIEIVDILIFYHDGKEELKYLWLHTFTSYLCLFMLNCLSAIHSLLASHPGRVGGERRHGIDCLCMRGRFHYIPWNCNVPVQ